MEIDDAGALLEKRRHVFAVIAGRDVRLVEGDVPAPADAAIGLVGTAHILQHAAVARDVFRPEPSTLSPVFVTGFMVNYLFWCLYGVRFRRFAMWFVNGVAMLLQLCLLGVALLK